MNATYNDLKEKVILITGASRGIGKQIAKSLASQGAHIVFNYRSNEAAALELKEELLKDGASHVSALSFDVTDYEKMKSEIDAFSKEHTISGLINNAGISKDQLAMKVKPSDIDDILNVNLKGAMNLTNILSRSFLRAKDVSIINISSVVGLMGNLSQTTYAASKAGMIGYSKSLAKELASRKVRVNVICPGFIQTQMTDELSDKVKEEYQKLIPLGDFGATEDVANLCSFLMSGASKYITGEVIKVDGGLYI
ncbi:MAG: SDR family oxidoreductase [Bacteriovoracaceae bacterium]|jgi:3-oxoacyl-[acyl-carrier protein] reductase|nr:SDR family oxidoreductase [Bacteriovoracaceae bacterium]